MDEVAEPEKPLEWRMWPPRATSEANRRVVCKGIYLPEYGWADWIDPAISTMFTPYTMETYETLVQM